MNTSENFSIANVSNRTYNGTLPNNVPAWVTYAKSLNAWLGVMMILAVVGSFLNIALFITLVTSKKLRRGSGTLIAHLILIEAIICLIHYPIITISTYVAHITPLSANFCRWAVLGYYLFMHCGNWSTMLIGINRFVAILFPHSYKKWTSKPALIGTMSIGWIVALAFDLPAFLGAGGTFAPIKPWGGCGTKVTSVQFNSVTTAVLTSVPVSALGLLYGTIFIKIGIQTLLNRNRVSQTGEDQNVAVVKENKSSVFRRRFRSAKMLFVSFIWYSACYLPAPIAASVYSSAYASVPLLQLAFRGLLLAGYAINPIIYLSMNEDYRRQFLVLLRLSEPVIRNLKEGQSVVGGRATADGRTMYSTRDNLSS